MIATKAFTMKHLHVSLNINFFTIMSKLTKLKVLQFQIDFERFDVVPSDFLQVKVFFLRLFIEKKDQSLMF